MRQWNRITVVAPHLDDECWSGALLARELSTNPEVAVSILWLSSNQYRHVDDAEITAESVQSLDVLRGISGVNSAQVRGIRMHMQPYIFSAPAVRECLFRTLPMDGDLILVPASADYHQDHQCVHDEAKRVLRHRDVDVLGYMVPKNGAPTQTHEAVVSLCDLEIKQRMIDCYQSQMWRGRNNAGTEERYEAIQLRL
jgi:LmbE family N-acetylglucosaminyl deacetylase